MLLTGCGNPGNQHVSPTPVVSVTPSIEPMPTNSSTPEPTSTPRPTKTKKTKPTSTSTLTPAVSKKEMIVYRTYGGDGADLVQYYLGGEMPEMVLYEDGQLIVQRDQSTYEKKLSHTEVADFLKHLQATGLLDIPRDKYYSTDEDPIYNFPPDMQFLDGIGAHVLRINLNGLEKQFRIEAQYLKYLIPKVQAGYDLIRTYFPPGMQSYRPRQVVLWIEPFEPENWYVTPTPPQPWPADLPPISELGEGHIIVADELVPRLLELFAKIPGGRTFTEGDLDYYVILYPLLPNQSPSSNWDN
jgi:hypothetical protein